MYYYVVYSLFYLPGRFNRIEFGECSLYDTLFQLNEKINEGVRVAAVCRFQRVNVCRAVVPGNYNRQVILPDQLPSQQRPRDPAIAILKGVYLGEGMM